MKVKYYILTLLLFCANLVFADGIKFNVSVSKTQVGIGEQFEVTFSINGNGESFVPPGLHGFQILSGPNVSTSMESINGATTLSNSFSYVLMAVTEGELTIGAATITVNGYKMSTKPVTIKVVKGRPIQQNNSAQNGPDNTINNGNANELSRSIFIKAVVNKNNVYVGQQLTVSYRLFTRVGIEDSQADKLPDLNGFFGEDIKKQQQAQWHVETYKGQQFNVADIKQTILFPQHAGNLTLDPIGMTFILKVPVASRDIMDQFFGSFKEVKYKVKSDPVIIHVKPLPDSGKPDSFTGAVGNFTIDATIDKTELKANDPLNYKVKITGAGNIKLFEPLKINFPADFEKYDPKVTDTVTENENGVSGSRTYNYLLIPRHGGDYAIEPLKFSYFNPATGRYTTLASKSFNIKVAKGKAENNVTAFSEEDKQDVKLLNKDIRYIKTADNTFDKQGDIFFGSMWYYLVILAGPVACCAAFVYRNKLRKDNSDIVKVKSKRAGRVAAKHLANAQKQLQANNTMAFYEDVFKGLYGYLSDKLNILYANLDRDTIAAVLRRRGVEEQLVNRLLETLDLCEMARYAPVKHISQQEVFDKAKSIINDIESEI